MDNFEFCIIGAGAIGLAVARAILASNDIDPEKVLIVDALPSFGQGISSRSSEVIHAGIYYPPNSLKARLCIEGKALLYDYVKEKSIPHRRCGKLIVAQAGQEDGLEKLHGNAKASGLEDLTLLSGRVLGKTEPEVHASSALLSPSTGIIDSHSFMFNLTTEIQATGAICAFNSRVEEISSAATEHEVQISAGSGSGGTVSHYRFRASHIVNCAGLNAASVAKSMTGLSPHLIPQTWLCKGDYFTYQAKNPFKHLIYPLPEPNTTGLGIHSTMDLSNQLRFGPDAYYIEEENYAVDPTKIPVFSRAVKRYFPRIDTTKLSPAYSGIRPKISGPGEPAQDFMFQGEAEHGLKGVLNLYGIESPGITSSLAIGRHVCSLFGLATTN